MFAFQEYIPYNRILNKSNHTLPTNICAIIYWHCSLFPSFPLEKFLPIYLQASLHPRVQALTECQLFLNSHSNMFDAMNNVRSGYTPRMHQTFESAFVPYKIVSKPTRRLFDAVEQSVDTIRSSLISMQLFSQLSCLETLCDTSDVVCVRFSNCKMQHFMHMLKTLNETIPECAVARQELFTTTVSASNNTFCFAASATRVKELQYYSFCEWISDKHNANQLNQVHQTFLKNAFNTSALSVMSLVLLINKRLSASRYYYRTIPRPTEAQFQLLRSLPSVLRDIASVSSVKPALFWRGLRAFIELNGQHTIEHKLFLALYKFFLKHTYAQTCFPQLWNTLTYLERDGHKKRYILSDVFVLNDQSVPSAAFLYALLLSPNIPKRLKSCIWHHTYTQSITVSGFPTLTSDRFLDVIVLVTGKVDTEPMTLNQWPLPYCRMRSSVRRHYAIDTLQQYCLSNQ